MRPVCVKCKREMKCVKNEVAVKDKGVLTQSGYHPSTAWCGDLYECLNCHAQIIAGFGQALRSKAMRSYEAEAMEIER